jgi:hypothetical protein
MARRAEKCMGIGMKMRWRTDIHGYQIVWDGESEQTRKEREEKERETTHHPEFHSEKIVLFKTALPNARSRRYRADPTVHKIREKTELRP